MLSLKKSITHLSLITSLVLSHSINATESDIHIDINGQKVIGTLNVPNNSVRPPVVLMLHGFMGNRDELQVTGTDEGIYSRAARIMAEQGIASLRIDFRGSGDSDGKWEDTTFSRQIEDANAAIKWLKNNPQVNTAKIGVLGWSQGGLIASHVAKFNPEVSSVVLWAPVTHPYMTYSNLMGTDLVLEATNSDPEKKFSATTPWGNHTTLKGKFFKEVLTMNPIGAIASYKGPLLVIRGTQDDLVVNTEAWTAYHDGTAKLVDLDTDHVWSAFSGPQMIDNNVMPETIAWFNNMK